MTLALTGDVMLGRLVDKDIIRNPELEPEHVWGDSLPLLRSADARLINLECVIAASGQRWRPWAKPFHFRAHPRAIDALTVAEIDFVSLANNHSMDYGIDALRECVDLLDRAGIVHSGAGRDGAEARRPAYFTTNGGTFAIVSLTDNEPSWEARDTGWGLFYIDYGEEGLRGPYRSYVEKAIAAARRSSGVVIVCAHVGANWGAPTRAMRALARQIVDMGADCYWGHSNHTPQGVEVYRGKPIIYSAGDFVDDYAVDPLQRNDLSFLFMLEWKKPAWKLALYPTKIEKRQVNRARGDEAALAMDRMNGLSRAFGTTVFQEEERLVIRSDR